MKKLKRTCTITSEEIKQIQTFSEILKTNINNQEILDSLFNNSENVDLIKLILTKKYKNEIEIFIIKTYLKSLHNFISVINESEDDSLNIDMLLQKISQDLKCENFKENTLLMKVGEIGKTFYVILSGSVDILVPKEIDVYMTKSEYIKHLKFLFKYKEDLLFDKTYSNNNQIYQIREDDIKIDEELRINYDINMKLNDYLNKINAVDLQIENNTKVHLKIVGYFKVVSLGIGNSFGDYALINENSLRTATIFVKENSFFGTLTKHSYQNSIKAIQVRINKLDMNFIYSTKLFEQIPFQVLATNYWNFFIKKRIKKDDYIFKYLNKNEEFIFFFDGEVTLSIPNLTLKKINEYISKIGNVPFSYEYYDDNDTPNDAILKYVKKGDILGMNDIVIENQFICNAVCKSENAVYFCIDIKIFNWILSHYDLVMKSWKKLENVNKNIMVDRLNTIKDIRNKGLIKNVREGYKKIDIDKICKNKKHPFDLNLFYYLKSNFNIESKSNKNINKRSSQTYIQKMHLNNRKSTRNIILLPKISSILNLNKENLVKTIFIKKNDKKNTFSDFSQSHSSLSLSSISKISTSRNNPINEDNNIQKNSLSNSKNKNPSSKNKNTFSTININPSKKKITIQNHISNNKSLYNKSLSEKKNLNLNKLKIPFHTENTTKTIKKIKLNHNFTNLVEFKTLKPQFNIPIKKIKKKISRTNKINTISDYETYEFAKRIDLNDPISNILVSQQSKKLKKTFMETNLYKTINNPQKFKKRIRFFSFNKSGIKFNNICTIKSNFIPANLLNSKNNSIKLFSIKNAS